MKRIVFLLLFMFLLLGCKTRQKVITKTVEREVEVIVRDTVFTIEKDSSRAVFKIVCDSVTGKPRLTPKTETPGKNVLPPKATLEDDTLTVDCETKAQELFARWKETHSKERIEIPVEVNVLTFWQEVQINLGRAFIVLAIAPLLINYLKPKK